MKKMVMLEEVNKDQAFLYDFETKKEIILEITTDEYELLEEIKQAHKEEQFDENDEAPIFVVYDEERKRLSYADSESELI